MGVIYYEMNTNKLPFNGYYEDELISEINKKTPDWPIELNRFPLLANLLLR